jgi:hypothetical protein
MSHNQPTVIVDSGASYEQPLTVNQLADELDDMLKAVGLMDNRVPTMLRKQAEEIEYWKEMFEKAMGYSKHLEAQVYGGTTK